MSDTLPVILVSAADTEQAESVISELVGEDGEEGAEERWGARVWRLHNKYYRARVRLRPLPDHAPPAHTPHTPEAHLVVLAPHEAGEELSERAGAGRGGCARVRLALCSRAPPPSLVSAARSLRYELVRPAALPAPGDSSDSDCEEGPDARGVARVRAALHAHTWPNLQLHRAPHPAHPPTRTDSSSSSCGGESGGEGEEAALERAELFADALAALPATPRAGDSERHERLQRAEALVQAFCRALGHDLDAC